MRSLDDIKDDFLSLMSQGQMLTGLLDAVKELEDPKGHGLNQHNACMLATRWAIDAGYFSPDEEDEVEDAAEEAVEDSSAA